MGAPSLSYFCRHGHFVFGTGHHEISEYTPEKCWCGCRDLAVVFEWLDDRYDQVVPATPSYYAYRYFWKTKKFVRFYVYDISRIPEQAWDSSKEGCTEKKRHSGFVSLLPEQN